MSDSLKQNDQDQQDAHEDLTTSETEACGSAASAGSAADTVEYGEESDETVCRIVDHMMCLPDIHQKSYKGRLAVEFPGVSRQVDVKLQQLRETIPPAVLKPQIPPE